MKSKSKELVSLQSSYHPIEKTNDKEQSFCARTFLQFALRLDQEKGERFKMKWLEAALRLSSLYETQYFNSLFENHLMKESGSLGKSDWEPATVLGF